MSKKDWLIGKILRSGWLSSSKGDILLSTLDMTEIRGGESATLTFSEQDIGKLAVVTGNLTDGTLYSSNLVEIVPKNTSALLEKITDNELVSLQDLQKSLEESVAEHAQLKKKLCALVIGHKKNSPGHKNTDKDISEFDFNDELARRIEKKVEKALVQRVYRRTVKQLPDDVNQLGPDFVVSLHCNAFNKKVTGTEMLYYYKSDLGRRMAEIMQNRLVEHLRLEDRGIKPKTSEDRGGFMLKFTKAPCVIAEPFFLDNNDDLAKARQDLDGLAGAYAKAIDEISEIL